MPAFLLPKRRAAALLIAWLGAAAAACESDHDCSLLGVCGADGACVCVPGWRGADCAVLDVLPTPDDNGYPTLGGARSSWGSSVLWSDDDQLYHAFVCSPRAVFYCRPAQCECDAMHWAAVRNASRPPGSSPRSKARAASTRGRRTGDEKREATRRASWGRGGGGEANCCFASRG